jgi:hypothetical protein
MTAQTPEILIIGDKTLAMCDVPLDPYLMRMRKAKRPVFARASTSCWRGYVGTWEIRDGMLTLTGLDSLLLVGDAEVEASLELAFPKAKDGLAATWFTGAVRCVEGLCLAYRHAGFGSEYERDRVFEFEKGRLRSEFVSLNPPPPVYYQIHPDGSRTCMDGMVRHAFAIEDPLDGAPFEEVYERVWAKRPEGEEYFGPLASTGWRL